MEGQGTIEGRGYVVFVFMAVVAISNVSAGWVQDSMVRFQGPRIVGEGGEEKVLFEASRGVRSSEVTKMLVLVSLPDEGYW